MRKCLIVLIVVAVLVGAVGFLRQPSCSSLPADAGAPPASVADASSLPDAITEIHSLPFVIAKSGHYRLMQDQSVHDPHRHCLTIQCDRVLLDLNGKTIACTSSDEKKTANCILAQNCNQLTIRNGRIAGFYMGVQINDVSRHGKYCPEHGHHHLHHLTLDDCTFRAVRVEGNHSNVHDLIIRRTGGTRLHDNAYAMGIESIGSHASIVANSICDTVATDEGEGVGICVSTAGDYSTVAHNVVCNRRLAPGKTIGIWIGHSRDILVLGNHVRNMKWGLARDDDDSRGYHARNVFVHVAHPLIPPYDEEFPEGVKWEDGGDAVKN